MEERKPNLRKKKEYRKVLGTYISELEESIDFWVDEITADPHDAFAAKNLSDLRYAMGQAEEELFSIFQPEAE